mmetsp:Transcript_9602/g.22071  ORF Transcript_9602/g.22071 Transcript_9602/m.22071 type:complete len:115 (+) Transcript_9602:68-412(+)
MLHSSGLLLFLPESISDTVQLLTDVRSKQQREATRHIAFSELTGESLSGRLIHLFDHNLRSSRDPTNPALDSENSFQKRIRQTPPVPVAAAENLNGPCSWSLSTEAPPRSLEPA